MRLIAVFALLALAGCAGNRTDDQDVRIRDTTLTPRDTVSPNDTLDRARGVSPDSAGVDTTGR